MNYPLEIMPKANYRELTDLGEIIKKTKICLLRRVDGVDSNSSEEEIKQFLEESIVSSRGQLSEYSLFLMGGEFEERHLSVTVHASSGTDDSWSEGNVCSVSDFVDRIEPKDNYAVVYFYGDELHEINFTKIPIQENQELTDRLRIVCKSGTLHASSNNSFLKHKPMNFNFWHVQIHFFDAEGNEFPPKSKLKRRHKEALVAFLQSVLIKRMLFKDKINSQCFKIDSKFYFKSS
jgi:hypothetical protein